MSWWRLSGRATWLFKYPEGLLETLSVVLSLFGVREDNALSSVFSSPMSLARSAGHAVSLLSRLKIPSVVGVVADIALASVSRSLMSWAISEWSAVALRPILALLLLRPDLSDTWYRMTDFSSLSSFKNWGSLSFLISCGKLSIRPVFPSTSNSLLLSFCMSSIKRWSSSASAVCRLLSTSKPLIEVSVDVLEWRGDFLVGTLISLLRDRTDFALSTEIFAGELGTEFLLGRRFSSSCSSTIMASSSPMFAVILRFGDSWLCLADRLNNFFAEYDSLLNDITPSEFSFQESTKTSSDSKRWESLELLTFRFLLLDRSLYSPPLRLESLWSSLSSGSLKSGEPVLSTFPLEYLLIRWFAMLLYYGRNYNYCYNNGHFEF